MSERLVIGGKLTDLTKPDQLGRLNDLLSQVLAIVNSFDQNSFALAWIEGDTAGQVIVSKGVGNAPEWDASPTLTGATFSGLTASHLVSLTAGKALTTTDPATFAVAAKGVTNGDSHDHSGGDGAQIDHAGLANLTTGDPHTQYQQESEKDSASGYAGLNASSRIAKGTDTADDLIVDLATKGLVLKDTQGTPHYWRVTVETDGTLTTTDVGTSKP